MGGAPEHERPTGNNTQIFVTYKDSEFSLQVQPDETIKMLKWRLYDIIGVFPGYQALVWKQRRVSNGT